MFLLVILCYLSHKYSQTHPFVHSILRHYLNLVSGPEPAADLSEALQVARRYSSVPLFAHALELLLHEVLEEDEIEREERKRASRLSIHDQGAAALTRAVEFLRNFPQFPDVVVQCARKRDKAVWGTLFAATGPPSPLFEVRCVPSICCVAFLPKCKHASSKH